MTHQSFIGPALALVLLSALLGGCAEMHYDAEVISRIGSSPASVGEAQAVPVAHLDVKTVRPRGAPLASASGTSAAEPVAAPAVEASAVPTPQEIFDFHPAGSAAGSFRQPFIIDPNDGPLTADVRRTAAELKEFKATMGSRSAIADSKRCSEMDVAHERRGCVGVKPKVVSTISRDPLAIQ